MGGEERRDALPPERVDDVERRGGRVDRERVGLGAAFEPLERVRERPRAAEKLGCGRVGEVLALPRDGELEERGGERGEDDRPNQADPAERTGVFPVASEEERELEEVPDRGCIIVSSSGLVPGSTGLARLASSAIRSETQ
jgi:hypothetical protein